MTPPLKSPTFFLLALAVSDFGQSGEKKKGSEWDRELIHESSSISTGTIRKPLNFSLVILELLFIFIWAQGGGRFAQFSLFPFESPKSPAGRANTLHPVWPRLRLQSGWLAGWLSLSLFLRLVSISDTINNGKRKKRCLPSFFPLAKMMTIMDPQPAGRPDLGTVWPDVAVFILNRCT